MGGGGGWASALCTQRLERAASADPGARTAPRRGRDFHVEGKRNCLTCQRLLVAFFHTFGGIPNGAFVRWAMQLLAVKVQRGNAEMFRRAGLIISREEDLRYDAGFAVTVLM